jgi:hypothetical protein
MLIVPAVTMVIAMFTLNLIGAVLAPWDDELSNDHPSAGVALR